MTERLTVVQIVPALDSGGVERGTLEIGRALVEAGHRSVVVSSGGRLVEELCAQGSEHVALPVHRKSLLSLRQVPGLRNCLVSVAADVVHVRSRVPAWLAWFALRGLIAAQRPGFVTTVHGLYSVNPYSAIMTRADRVIAVSETARSYVEAHYRNCPRERVTVIQRGVDPAIFRRGYRPDEAWRAAWQAQYPHLQGRTLITLPGRITRLKGHEHLLTLIARLKAQGVAAHGLIVGGAEARKADYLASLKARVAAEGLSEDVTFTGLRTDIREVLAISDVVLSLSTQPESFGRTTLEALALGAPVVGWDHGGVGEILARMFPQGAVAPGDSGALVGRVRDLLATRPVPLPLPEEFFLARMCERTLDVYQALASERAKSVKSN